MCPLMSVSRNFFLGNEPTRGWGPFKRYDADAADRISRGRAAPAWASTCVTPPRPWVRSPAASVSLSPSLARSTSVPRSSSSTSPPPRSASRKRPSCCATSWPPRRGAGHHPHHPQRQPRLPGRRALRGPRSRPHGGDVREGRAAARRAAQAHGWRRGAGPAQPRAGGVRRRGRGKGSGPSLGGSRPRRAEPCVPQRTRCGSRRSGTWRLGPACPSPPSAAPCVDTPTSTRRTRERVEEAARQLNYRPSRRGSIAAPACHADHRSHRHRHREPLLPADRAAPSRMQRERVATPSSWPTADATRSARSSRWKSSQSARSTGSSSPARR